MNIVFLIVGLILGVGVAVLLCKTKAAGVVLAANEKAALLERRIQEQSVEILAVRKDSEEKLHSEKKLSTDLNANLATACAEKEAIQQKLDSQKLELEGLNKRFATEFENLANKILATNSATFAEQNKTNIETILNPLKTKLGEFKDQVEKSYKTESDERIALKEEIKQLAKLNQQVSDDANQLAVALKGDQKQQGCWGEMVLEKVLEASGLRKGEEYHREYATDNSEGERIRPDVVVSLPNSKHVIVDSKVSLVAYVDCMNAVSEEERAQRAKDHIQSIKTHVKGLGDKHYPSAKDLDCPDFVLMFLPIESALSLAVHCDPSIIDYALEKKIIIVSPSTLLAALKTVASFWNQERQARNALDIAEEGGKLFDKFVNFCADLEKVGKRIGDAQKEYDEAMKKLHTGTGNLIRRAEKMKELGIKANKQLPRELVDRAIE